MKRMFLGKFFPASRTATIKREICGIRQHSGETLHEYWERFNKLQLAIGQHQPNIAARVCGICTSVEHPTDMCPTLQEIESDHHFGQGQVKGHMELNNSDPHRMCLKDQQVINN
ncbi:hypothetical protein CR513_15176, partial [Mucuna pruriens]